MVTIEEIKDIKLFDSKGTFCANQGDCINCVLTTKNLINTEYGQPCTQIYELLKMINKEG